MKTAKSCKALTTSWCFIRSDFVAFKNGK